MSRYPSLFKLVCSLTVLTMPLLGSDDKDASEEESFCKAIHPYRVTARHIEGGGIGYKDGYTTLEAFFAPYFGASSFVPLFDARGHVFNNGKWAMNAGLGGRILFDHMVCGINAYYDYRHTNRRNYQQVGAGLEFLGERWELRANGYLPVGRRTTSLYDTEFFDFEGNEILLRSKRKRALTAADAELGTRVFCGKTTDLYVGAGPYFLSGEPTPQAWGGKGRATVRWKDMFFATLSGSYDRLFKAKIQGEVGLSLPFGRSKRLKGRSCGSLCALENRLFQPIQRSEIIPIKSQKVDTVAIDPATGEPYTVWFVDNTSSSAGTFESPFSNLAAAQAASGPNDIIYIYPGNGTALNGGIVLKSGQKLYSSSVDHTLPSSLASFTIPVNSSAQPILNNSGGDVVTLSSNNEVSGFQITGPGGGDFEILGSGISNANINRNNFFSIVNGSTHITFTNVTGTVTIDQNVFSIPRPSLTTQGVNITGTASASYSFTNNSFYNNTHSIRDQSTGGTRTLYIADNVIAGGTNGVTVGITNSQLVLEVYNNSIDAMAGSGLSLGMSAGALDATISGNTMTAINITGISFGLGATPLTATIEDNSITAGQNGIDYAQTTSGTDIGASFTINNNTLNAGDNGFFSSITINAPVTLDFSNNTVSAFSAPPDSDVASGISFATESPFEVNLTGNTILTTSGPGISFTSSSENSAMAIVIEDNYISSNVGAISTAAVNVHTGQDSTLQISGNTIIASSNGVSSTGIDVINGLGFDLTSCITDNVIIASEALDYVNNSFSTTCLKYQNNQDPLQSVSTISNPLDAVSFDLEPLTGNGGTFALFGSFTDVPNGFCGCSNDSDD